MRSTRLALPYHRVHVTKRVLVTVRKSVVDLTRCSFTISRERTPSALLSSPLLAVGLRRAVIGTTCPLRTSSE